MGARTRERAQRALSRARRHAVAARWGRPRRSRDREADRTRARPERQGSAAGAQCHGRGPVYGALSDGPARRLQYHRVAARLRRADWRRARLSRRRHARRRRQIPQADVKRAAAGYPDAVAALCSLFFSFFSVHGATFNSNSMPGMAAMVQMTKNCVHPTASTMNPVEALANVRGTAIKLLNRANWVAVKALLVSLAMKAVSATLPRPTARYSPLTTTNRPMSVCPAWLSHTNGRMVNICTKPNSHNARLMLSLSMARPLIVAPAIPAHRPANLATVPISVLL